MGCLRATAAPGGNRRWCGLALEDHQCLKVWKKWRLKMWYPPKKKCHGFPYVFPYISPTKGYADPMGFTNSGDLLRFGANLAPWSGIPAGSSPEILLLPRLSSNVCSTPPSHIIYTYIICIYEYIYIYLYIISKYLGRHFGLQWFTMI